MQPPAVPQWSAGWRPGVAGQMASENPPEALRARVSAVSFRACRPAALTCSENLECASVLPAEIAGGEPVLPPPESEAHSPPASVSSAQRVRVRGWPVSRLRAVASPGQDASNTGGRWLERNSRSLHCVGIAGTEEVGVPGAGRHP